MSEKSMEDRLDDIEERLDELVRIVDGIGKYLNLYERFQPRQENKKEK